MIDSYGNEIWEQDELFTNSWGVNSGFKHLQEKLDELITFEGRCENPMSKNKHLEKFRRAQNAAYDLFNNGLWNKKALFKNIYGFAPSVPSWTTKEMWNQWSDRVEEVLTPIIIAAAKEQGIK